MPLGDRYAYTVYIYVYLDQVGNHCAQLRIVIYRFECVVLNGLGVGSCACERHHHHYYY